MEYATMIEQFTPTLRFHPNEYYFPCSIEHYLSNSVRYNRPFDEPLTPDTLCDGINDSGSVISINENAWKYDFNSSAPIYVTTYETSLLYVIQYIFLYSYNGYKNVLGLFHVGGHQCDIERITVRITKETGQIHDIYFGAHTHKDGLWVKHEDIEFDGTHPVVYIAQGTHATYSKPGTYIRYFGFGNDKTSTEGISWIPENVVYIDENTPWNQFRGRLGAPYECPTPLHHLWWREENGISTNWWKRLFGL